MSSFNRVMCVLTQLQQPEDVVEYALQLCKRHNAELTVMLVIEPLPPNANMVMESFAYIDTFQNLKHAAEKGLAEKAERWRNTWPVTTRFAYGHGFVEVAKAVAELNADLVIKAAKVDLLDRLFGHEDMRLLRKCPAPVWLTHSCVDKGCKTVVAAVDVNYHYPEEELAVRKQLNETAVIQAAQIAEHENAHLHLVHVVDEHVDMVVYDGIVDITAGAFVNDQEETERERQAGLDALIELIRSANPDDVVDKLDIQSHILFGNARRDIPPFLEQINADLLVMGTVARVGIPGFFMGNTAESILNQVSCSVLALKPHGFTSPLIT